MKNTLSRCRPLLGTFVEITLSASADDRQLLAVSSAAFTEINRLEQLLSFHDSASELSSINRHAAKRPIKVSPETEKVIAAALTLSKASNGCYDITIAPQLIKQGLLPAHHPEEDWTGNWQDIELHKSHIHFKRPLLIDLGGIAKGFAVDWAMALCEQIKSDHENLADLEITINAGGDIRMSHWRNNTINIRDPHKPRSATINQEMMAPAAATSASYFTPEGRSAFICTDTCQPVFQEMSQDEQHRRLSVTVFAANCMLADGLTKIALLHPEPKKILDQFQAQCVTL